MMKYNIGDKVFNIKNNQLDIIVDIGIMFNVSLKSTPIYTEKKQTYYMLSKDPLCEIDEKYLISVAEYRKKVISNVI